MKHLWVSSQRGGSTCEKHRGAGGGRPPHSSQDGVGRWVQLNFFPDHNSKAHSCWRMNSLFDPECHGREAKEHEGRRRKERGRAREKGEAGGGPGMQGVQGWGWKRPREAPAGARAEAEARALRGQSEATEVPATLPTWGGRGRWAAVPGKAEAPVSQVSLLQVWHESADREALRLSRAPKVTLLRTKNLACSCIRGPFVATTT